MADHLSLRPLSHLALRLLFLLTSVPFQILTSLRAQPTSNSRFVPFNVGSRYGVVIESKGSQHPSPKVQRSTPYLITITSSRDRSPRERRTVNAGSLLDQIPVLVESQGAQRMHNASRDLTSLDVIAPSKNFECSPQIVVSHPRQRVPGVSGQE